MEHPLIDMVLKGRLFIALADGKRNFAVCGKADGLPKQTLLHGKDFGDEHFFARLDAGKSPGDMRIDDGLIWRIIDMQASHKPPRKRRGDPANDWLRARAVAVKALGTISNPYDTPFETAEQVSAEVLTKNADPAALMTAFDPSSGYQVIIAQSDNLRAHKDFYPTTDTPSGKTSYTVGAHCSTLKRIWLTTGEKMPLDKVGSSRMALLTSRAFGAAAAHEFGHLTNQYDGPQQAAPRLNAMSRLVKSDRDNLVKICLSLLGSLPPSDKSNARLITERYGLTNYPHEPQALHRRIIGGMQTLADTLAPIMDLREEPFAKDILNKRTLENIEQAFTHYKPNERRAEIPARMHQLCKELPPEFIRLLLPNLTRAVAREVAGFTARHPETTTSVERLRQGKPILSLPDSFRSR